MKTVFGGQDEEDDFDYTNYFYNEYFQGCCTARNFCEFNSICEKTYKSFVKQLKDELNHALAAGNKMVIAITIPSQKLEAKGLLEVGFTPDKPLKGNRKHARQPNNPLILWSIEVK